LNLGSFAYGYVVVGLVGVGVAVTNEEGVLVAVADKVEVED
jgi:hypothetical protein